MTDYQITEKNLILLRNAWKAASFEPNMQHFGGIDTMYSEDLELGEINHCGTNCCALGYAPSVEGLEITKKDFRNKMFNYEMYSTRIFPYLESESDYKWTYLFGMRNPNSRQAFLNRLNLFLDNGLDVPK